MRKSSDTVDPVDSFLSSLTYWQEVNLKMNILKLDNPEISKSEAFEQAALSDSEPLKYDLEKMVGTVVFLER